MKLGDLCAITDKNGFYITDKKAKCEKFYQDADDFYEQPYAKYEMEREVIWITTKNNRLNIILGD